MPVGWLKFTSQIFDFSFLHSPASGGSLTRTRSSVLVLHVLPVLRQEAQAVPLGPQEPTSRHAGGLVEVRILILQISRSRSPC
jgi:hypothetical protein